LAGEPADLDGVLTLGLLAQPAAAAVLPDESLRADVDSDVSSDGQRLEVEVFRQGDGRAEDAGLLFQAQPVSRQPIHRKYWLCLVILTEASPNTSHGCDAGEVALQQTWADSTNAKWLYV
jgi:hypothetical protein